MTFRFEVQDPPPPVPNNSTGTNNPNGIPGWSYTPIPIYFVYEWTAEAIRGTHAPCCGANTAHTTLGQMPDTGGDFRWTEPQIPYYSPMTTDTWSGSRAGVFYTYTGIRDYRFIFDNNVGGAGSWGPSVMDFNIRLAFSDQPFTSIPSAAVPEPETYAMLLAGLGLLGFTARRKKSRTE